MKRSFVCSILLSYLVQLPGCAPNPLEPDPVGPTDGWRVFHPLPGGYGLFDLWSESSSDVWAVGAYGSIVHWDGETVRRVDSPTQSWLKSLDGWSHDDIYAAGEDVLLHYDGHTWDIIDKFPDQTVHDLLCTEDGRLYLAGSMGLQIRDTGGWRTVAGPTAECETVWRGADGQIRAGDGSRIWIVDHDRATLEQDFPELAIRHGDGGYAAAEKSEHVQYILSHTPGSGWTDVGSQSSLRTVLDMDGPIVSVNGGLLSGDGWIWSNDSGRWINGLARSGSDGLLACGYGGTLMAGIRGADGFTWHESAQDLGYGGINVFDGTGCDDIWAGEWWGRVLHYDGHEWTREYTPLPDDWFVSGIQALADGWVVAISGREIALRHPDGGWSGLPPIGRTINSFYAVASDSIVAATSSGLYVWNGATWSDVGPITGFVWGLTVTASGTLYALVYDETTTLQIWNGEGFTTVVEIPDFYGRVLCTSRTTDVLWIGGYMLGQHEHTAVFRYNDGHVLHASGGTTIPGSLLAMTELRSEDLFVLVKNKVWRYKDGTWSIESGLPAAETYWAIWSHPDCGVFVEGHPTFFKDFSHE